MAGRSIRILCFLTRMVLKFADRDGIEQFFKKWKD